MRGKNFNRRDEMQRISKNNLFDSLMLKLLSEWSEKKTVEI